jgi:uncharacterized delta-60 repeat protein
MKKITFLIASLIAVTTLNAQDGVLDNTFGTNGRVITDIVAENNEARDLVIQPDGKIVVAGKSSTGSIDQFALARYDVNGVLDNTFGSGGLVVTNVSMGDDVIRGMALQTDGKIVVVGYAGVANEYLAVARYNADGTLDNTFATNGIDSLLILNNPGDGDRSVPNDVKIQADGKIVVAGFVKDSGGNSNFAVVRYNSNGTLDTSFGIGGKQMYFRGFGDSELESLAIQSDGKIVIAGHYYNGADKDFYVARINQFGMDNSFGTNGVATYDFGSGNDEAWAVALQTDGSILLAGNVSNGNDADFGLLKYTTAGVLDNTFGTAGVVTTELGANVDDYPIEVIMQPDGKILVTGVKFGTTQDLVIARYSAAGTLDNTFGTNGLVIDDINNTNQIAFDIALQTDGKIVITGVSDEDLMTSRYTSGLVGIEDVIELSSFNIYPNPVKDQLTITTENEKINSIKIIDVTGKTIKVVTENTTTINVADLPKGLYILQIQTEKEVVAKRFIKE